MKRALIALSLLALSSASACKKKVAPVEIDAGAAAPESTSGPTAPLPTSAPREAREKAVIALLSGATRDVELELAANDSDKPFEPGLRTFLTSAPRKSKTLIGDVAATGIPVVAIKKTLTPMLGALARCHQHGLLTAPALTGKIQVTLTIDGEGKTKSVADATSEFPDPRVVACALRALRTAVFARPDLAPAQADVTFNFSPG